MSDNWVKMRSSGMLSPDADRTVDVLESMMEWLPWVTFSDVLTSMVNLCSE